MIRLSVASKHVSNKSKSRCVSGLDGSRIPNLASPFLNAEAVDDDVEERLERLAALRAMLVEACGGEEAYVRLVASIDEPCRCGGRVPRVLRIDTGPKRQTRSAAIGRARALQVSNLSTHISALR